jgi:hypothetical protein
LVRGQPLGQSRTTPRTILVYFVDQRERELLTFVRSSNNKYYRAQADSPFGGPTVRYYKLLSYLAAVLLLCLPLSVLGQAVSATLLGTVTDSTGAAVPNAKVTITSADTSAVHTVATNSSGNYTFPDLAPGTYSVSAEGSGFKKVLRNDVDVAVNSSTRIDLSLQTGSVSETVTVTDTPPVLQTDRADVSFNMPAQQVEDMPLSVNRNFQGLINLIPGSTPATFEHSQFFNAQSSLQTRVNGVPRMGNSYQIEGIDDTERTGLLQIIIPPAEAIQSVDISTNNFEAELGRATGVVTNVILKSGTNSLHGFAEEFLQNQAFNAKNYFSTTLPHVVYNYFGGGVGGPIIKDKLFFYADYLRTDDYEANNNNLTIPLKAFSTPVTCTAGGGQCLDLSSAINPNGAGVIYDPATGNPDGTGRRKFANNQIPLGRVNPVSLKILQTLPTENRPVPNGYTLSNDYNINLPFVKTSDTYDAKVDYSLTDKDHLSARYSFQKVNTIQAPAFGSFLGGPASGGFEANGVVKSYSTGLTYNHVFSPTLLTEVRVGVGHLANSAQPTDYGKSDAATLGANGVNIGGQPFTTGQVGITLNGGFSNPIIGYSPSVPWIRAEANIDMVNHWTKVLHNHTVKFGADVRRIRDDLLQDQTFSPRGLITFSENQTACASSTHPTGDCTTAASTTNLANDMASFLLDLPSQAGRDLNTFFPAYRDWWVFAFVGDKWQATPKLTLDLGLRWEFYPPATPKVKSGFSQYDYVNNQLLLAGVGGIPLNAGIKSQYKYFAPRTGFAYRTTDATVIRGGFGISYTQFPDNNYLYNYPVRANNAYNPAGSSFGPAVLADGVTVPTFQVGFPAPVPIPIPSNGIIPTNTAQLVASNYFSVPTNYHNPYVMAYNLTVQQALPGQFSLQLGYVGNRGVHIAANQNINVPSTYGGGAASEPEYNLPNPLPGPVLHRTASTNLLFLGTSSNYNSLQVQLQRRFTKGLAWSSAFTWGKAMNYMQGDDGGLTYFINFRRNYAPADFDRRLNFEQSFTYELPIGKGHRWLNSGMGATVLGGWKVAGIVSIVSGTPIANGITANGGTLNTPGTQQNANLVGIYKTPKRIGSGNQWFDKTAFAQPQGCTAGTTCTGIVGVEIGNTNRNQFYGPGFVQDNLSAFKDFKFTERLILNARVDAFQLSNTPQFANPGNSFGSGNFGQVTSTFGSGVSGGINSVGGARTLQLSAKLSF